MFGYTVEKNENSGKFIVPQTNVHFLVYEVKTTRAFENLDTLRCFLDSLAPKALELGFIVKKIEIRKTGGANEHWGFLPTTFFEFSGQLDLERIEATSIEGFDEKNQPKRYEVHDSWSLVAHNTGEVDAFYGTWVNNSLPGTFEEGQKFVAEISLNRLVN